MSIYARDVCWGAGEVGGPGKVKDCATREFRVGRPGGVREGWKNLVFDVHKCKNNSLMRNVF